MRVEGSEFLTIFVATLIMSLISTPLARSLAFRFQITDVPDGNRKLQGVAMPYLGGLAVALAISITTITGLLIKQVRGIDLGLALSVLVPGLFLAIVGFLDDKQSLKVAPRLVAQIGAGAITALLSSLGGTYSHLTTYRPLDIGISLIWIVTLINAYNFMDNMDGLSGSLACLASATFFVIALGTGQYLVASLSLSVSAACLGFLVFNWSPARIYMGDAGALFLGYILAVIALRVNIRETSHSVSLLIPLIVLLIPLLDTATVIISRIRRGVSPLTGGRDHLSHRVAHFWQRKRPMNNSIVNNRWAVLSLIAAQVCASLVAIGILKIAT